uniref:HNH endonuclease n=1 Tax=Methylobacterium sp. B34 TaxID=95563 RepID=UPI0006790992|nr:HNH endonuclease [Methylobacterium sp. B34]
MECLHGDDDRANPALANLEWGTRQQNAADRAARGRAARGEANGGGGKLTEKDVRAIRALTGKAKGSDVGRQFGVTKEMIYAIWKGKTWRHVT